MSRVGGAYGALTIGRPSLVVSVRHLGPIEQYVGDPRLASQPGDLFKMKRM